MNYGILPGYDPPDPPPEHYEKCPECGGDCYEVQDHGFGLVTYECMDCHCVFQNQYEWDDPDETWFGDEEIPF